jgi:GST-like protein
MGGFGPTPHQLSHFREERGTTAATASSAILRKPFAFTACSTSASAKPNLSGGETSIVDFEIIGWAWRHERHQIDLAHFHNVMRWYETLMARPGAQHGFAVTLS